MKRTKSIGVFDSGFGGLHILSGIVKVLPEYGYVYLGDSARVPYGGRTHEEIYRFTKQALDFFFAHECDFAILACNSASSEALRRIQQTYLKKYPDKKVLGTVVPTAEEATRRSRTGRIGVVATEATVHARAFTREIQKINPNAIVFEQACPLLVPLVEAGIERGKLAEATVAGSLKPLLGKSIDTLVLGCTHYGILEPLIRRSISTSILTVSPHQTVPAKLADYLARHPEIEQTLSQNYARRFLTTGSAAEFQKLGSRFFGEPIKARKVKIS